MAETFRAEYVRCGKPGCKTCPHGPYWYAYEKRRGKLHKRYIGLADPRPGTPVGEEPHPWEKILNARTASAKLAYEILDLTPPVTVQTIHLKYKWLALKHHPDRGGDTLMMQFINAAYSYIKGMYF